MRVLVTGGGGFIGSHVVELLLQEGHHVRALARYNGRGDFGHLRAVHEDLRPRLELKLGDVSRSIQDAKSSWTAKLLCISLH